MKTIDELLEAVKWTPEIKVERIKKIPPNPWELWNDELAKEIKKTKKREHTMYVSTEGYSLFQEALKEETFKQIRTSKNNENNK